jgi:hypothetical protein
MALYNVVRNGKSVTVETSSMSISKELHRRLIAEKSRRNAHSRQYGGEKVTMSSLVEEALIEYFQCPEYGREKT